MHGVILFLVGSAEQLNDNNYQTYVGLIEPLTARRMASLQNYCGLCFIRYRNIQLLVETLAQILDTRSKRSLWIHILALLPASHQNYARKKIDLPNGFLRGQSVAIDLNGVWRME